MSLPPTPAEAWAHQAEVVTQLTEAIKKPDPCAVPVTDTANTAAFVAAARSAAERWQVNLATVVDIAARYKEQVRAAAESSPTPETLYDHPFTSGRWRFWKRLWPPRIPTRFLPRQT